MAKETRKKTVTDGVTDTLIRINARHGLNLTQEDVQYFDGVVYISHTKAAGFFRASPPIFSSQYVPALTGKKYGYQWVRRMPLGKTRWYAFEDLEKVRSLSIEQNVSVFDLCKTKPK
jgi:hypothetical protein